MIKKLLLFITLFLLFNHISAQEKRQFYIEIEEGYELGIIHTQKRSNNSLEFTIANQNFQAFLNSKQIFEFKIAFKNALMPRLKRTYFMSIEENISIQDFIDRDEIFRVEEIFEGDINNSLASESVATPSSFPVLPDDYEDILSGKRNPDLDLIRAPQAWQITRGNPNVLVGVVDTQVDLNHEDLAGQIVYELNTGNTNTHSHGTSVASLIAGKTNNGRGIASIAHESRLVTTTDYQEYYSTLDIMANIPNVKVLNCSWRHPICAYNETHDLLIEDIVVNRNVLVVAAAGNGTQRSAWCHDSNGGRNGYVYPASYPYSLSVAGVGNRYPIGSSETERDPETDRDYYHKSWKDVHRFRPGTSDYSSQTHNDKVDISAPGQLVLTATDNYTVFSSGYRLSSGTSEASPIVAGVAALVFAANPALTALEVKDILKNTADDIYHIPYNQPYEGLLGTGRVNAYRAVMMAKCMANPEPNLDLMIRNSLEDYGTEPDVTTDRVFWNSPDIWVRNQDDGHYLLENQNPRYHASQPNYVYVRVTNRSCVTSSGTEELELYWSKANTSLNWPTHWDGSLYVDGVQMGDKIGVLSIPSLEPGEETIIKFPWQVPNPEHYFGINENPWHFCLLGRIVTNFDPMTTPEESFITSNVKQNNNLGWKNVTIVNLPPQPLTSFVGASVGVNNFSLEARPINLSFEPQLKNHQKPLHELAEVTIHLDSKLYEAWKTGGYEGDGIKEKSDGKLLITEQKASLDNILLPANEYASLSIEFNFLIKEFKERDKFIYHVIQTDPDKEDAVGGEVFEINTQERNVFQAMAGMDKTIEKNETITLQAMDIQESAVYNWFDEEGNLLYTGKDFSVSPEFSQQYKLEVISDLDGYKDYSEVNISVNPFALTKLIPNPASSNLRIHYTMDYSVTSAFIMIVHQISGSSNNYLIDVQQDYVDLDISILPAGLYTVVLVADGEIKASKGLIKQ